MWSAIQQTKKFTSSYQLLQKSSNYMEILVFDESNQLKITVVRLYFKLYRLCTMPTQYVVVESNHAIMFNYHCDIITDMNSNLSIDAFFIYLEFSVVLMVKTQSI